MIKNNLKIMIFTYEYYPKIGGVGTYTYNIAKTAAKLGFNVTLLAPSFNFPNVSSFDESQSFKTIRYKGGRKVSKINLLYLIYNAYFYLRTNYKQYDIIHCTDWPTQIALNVVSKLIPLEFSITNYGSEILAYRSNKLLKFLSSGLFNRAKAIITISEFTKHLIEQHHIDFVNSERINVIPCGIGHNMLYEPIKHVNHFKKRLGIAIDCFVFLTLSRIDIRKGHELVLKCLINMPKEILEKIKYVIVGEGFYMKKLKKIVQDYNLDKYVIFTGYIEECDKIAIYDLCDVYIMPSRQVGVGVEGFGISFLEAAARGKPSIASNHGGVPEVVLNSKTGLLVEQDDLDGLKNAMISIYHNEKLCKNLGIAAKERVKKEFTWERITQKTFNFLDRKGRCNLSICLKAEK